MKFAQDEATRIAKRIVDQDMDAKQFEISRQRIQQLAKEYRETGRIPQLKTLRSIKQ